MEEETYIHEDNATVTVESYAPKFPIESTAIKDDAVFEFVDTLRKDRGILSAAETEVINVWTYKNPISGYYPAEKQFCSVQLDEFGFLYLALLTQLQKHLLQVRSSYG